MSAIKKKVNVRYLLLNRNPVWCRTLKLDTKKPHGIKKKKLNLG